MPIVLALGLLLWAFVLFAPDSSKSPNCSERYNLTDECTPEGETHG